MKDLLRKAKKEQKIVWWKEIVASQKPPPPYDRWTEDDKQRLLSLQSEDVIGIKDTISGCKCPERLVVRRKYQSSRASFMETGSTRNVD